MKKHGLLHPQLARIVASLGHNDFLVIADAGLPVPAGVERVDLAFAPNQPAFLTVLDAVLGELEVERMVFANELKTTTAGLNETFVNQVLGRTGSAESVAGQRTASSGNALTQFVSHEEFKTLTAQAKAVVRTGEFTPYANVILVAGVVF